MKRVIVGMSGGVDSSVTALLLKKGGYDVIGVSFILYESRLRRNENYKNVSCCSIEAIKEASIVASCIGIEHTIVDLRTEFLKNVIEIFIDGYRNGITPNPCILCNRYIKFPYLMSLAEEKGADFISTGHYARTENGLLYRGMDAHKDQSYFLYVLKKNEIERLILPLGNMNKSMVRDIARSHRLPVFKRPESQEICFIQEPHYQSFLDKVIDGNKSGPIIDIHTGKVLGTHKGIHHYTVGQRKGIGVSMGYPVYVVRIDSKENALYVGRREDIFAREFSVKDINWIVKKRDDFRATVKIRSMMEDEPALVKIIDSSTVRVVFDVSQWAPAPGQSAVFYDGALVIGGGVIVKENL